MKTIADLKTKLFAQICRNIDLMDGDQLLAFIEREERVLQFPFPSLRDSTDYRKLAVDRAYRRLDLLTSK